MVLRYLKEEFMMRALVNKIIPFSNVDGPGNRIAIFFQKCPFECLYCHNPETINECVHCGVCIDTCPTFALKMENGKVKYTKNLCCDCDTCIKVCPNMASAKVLNYSVDELMDEIKKYLPFVRGITVSGGECMEYPDFLFEFFSKVKAYDKTCLIDSNGYYDFEKYEKLLNLSDGVMLDVKAVNLDFHKKITFRSNEIVLKNLNYLNSLNKLVEVRTVLLPKFDKENLDTVKYVSSIIDKDVQYKLTKYRHFGVRKEGVELFGKNMIDELQHQALYETALSFGLKNVVKV